MRRVERGLTQLLDSLNEKIKYWNLKELALVDHLWGTRFGRGYGL